MFDSGVFTLKNAICDCYESRAGLPAIEIYKWDITQLVSGESALEIQCRFCEITLTVPGQSLKMGIQVLEPRLHIAAHSQMDMDLELDIDTEDKQTRAPKILPFPSGSIPDGRKA